MPDHESNAVAFDPPDPSVRRTAVLADECHDGDEHLDEISRRLVSVSGGTGSQPVR
jgi:hypothetical protein